MRDRYIGDVLGGRQISYMYFGLIDRSKGFRTAVSIFSYPILQFMILFLYDLELRFWILGNRALLDFLNDLYHRRHT